MASKEIHVVFAYGGHWAICPSCYWDSGAALTRSAAYAARAEHATCTGTPPAHYSTQRLQENQVMLSGQS